MPHALSKVQKHVKQKKGKNLRSLHENSRDAKRLRRAGARDDRVSKTTSIHEKANRHWLDRVSFLQQQLPDTLHPLDLEQIQSLIARYIARNDDELEEIRSERRPGRPASTRQTLLEQANANETKEYASGFWLPNLQDEQTLVQLDGWKGEWVGLGTMKFVRLDSKGTIRDSSFPPRGSS